MVEHIIDINLRKGGLKALSRLLTLIPEVRTVKRDLNYGPFSQRMEKREVYPGGREGGYPGRCVGREATLVYPPWCICRYTLPWYTHPIHTLGTPSYPPSRTGCQRSTDRCIRASLWAQDGRKTWVGASPSPKVDKCVRFGMSRRAESLRSP